MIRRYLRLAAFGLAAVAYVWVAAVRHSSAVKARKAARREAARKAVGDA